MTYATATPVVGQPMANLIGLNLTDTTARLPTGTIQSAVSAYWGGGEFIYARADGAIRGFGLCQLNPVFDSGTKRWRFEATEAASTIILGRPICVSQAAMVAGDFGWFCVGGLTPVNSNAAVAANTTFSIAATGQGGAAANGKQIVNARIVGASTITVAKTNSLTVGLSTLLQVSDSDGWFVGAYLSGTGVASGATITSISPDGRTVTMSLASTAAIVGTVTATYNNATIFYNIAHINRPFQQGSVS